MWCGDDIFSQISLNIYNSIDKSQMYINMGTTGSIFKYDFIQNFIEH